MDKLVYMNECLSRMVWGKYMIAFLFLCGAWLLITNRFLPFLHVRLIWRKTLGSLSASNKKGGITPFQAVSTALAGTLGVGSIVGVTTALTMGGPGALFWMCISACFGMMIKYAEVVLAIHYRNKERDGTYIGGPMTTLENGCHMGILGVIFAVLCIFASFGIGNLTPANTIAQTLQTYVDWDVVWIGIGLAIFIGVIIAGKAKGIMRFNEIIIPAISILYLGALMYLIIMHREKLPFAIQAIMQDAFTIPSAAGGVSGFAISKSIHYGISRGVFSNEAGMGSSPLSHASVSQVNAVEQGFWGIFEVFFDTIVVCMLTGIMILTSEAYQSNMEGVALTIACFVEGFGKMGGILFACSILAFAIPSILGWYYYAQVCLRYLFKGKLMLYIYQCVFIVLLIVGSGIELRFAWEVADTLNGCMAIPNLISLVILYKTVVKLTKEYLNGHRSD